MRLKFAEIADHVTQAFGWRRPLRIARLLTIHLLSNRDSARDQSTQLCLVIAG